MKVQEADVIPSPTSNNVLNDLQKKLDDKGSLDGLSEEKKAEISMASMTSSEHDSKCHATEDIFFSSLEKDSILKALAQTGKLGRCIFNKQFEGPVMHSKIQIMNNCLIQCFVG